MKVTPLPRPLSPSQVTEIRGHKKCISAKNKKNKMRLVLLSTHVYPVCGIFFTIRKKKKKLAEHSNVSKNLDDQSKKIKMCFESAVYSNLLCLLSQLISSECPAIHTSVLLARLWLCDRLSGPYDKLDIFCDIFISFVVLSSCVAMLWACV